MAEPMDDSLQTQDNATSDSTGSRPISVLRPGGMVSLSITPEDYAKEYWPQLESAINQLLTLSPGDYIPISYEQMYSCVYKCVCKQFSERLYTDLRNHICAHLERVCHHLQVVLQDKASQVYVEQFSFAVTQYLQALTGIVPIFNYMNRFYIESKLKTNLNVELKKLFSVFVVEKHATSLLSVLIEAQNTPFVLSPSIMADLIKNLYSLNPDICKLNIQLFAKYIPGILPATSEAQLEQYIAETRQMQQELINNFEFKRGYNCKKRPTDEDVARGTPVSSVP